VKRTALKVILGSLVLVAGCTAAAHIHQLQPSAVAKSPPAKVSPVGSTVPTVSAPGVFQRGVDIDAYTYPGQNVAKAAAADVAYIKSLHANAVSISFPLFMTGPTSSTIYTRSSTPTPAQLAVIIKAAERAGLYVSIRPLLAESAFHFCRCQWIPPRPGQWFRSYRKVLLPYARMAQAVHAGEFFTGAEFSRFAQYRQWAPLDAAVRGVYHGTLACANNWGLVTFAGNCGPGLAETVDAYPTLLGALGPAWARFDTALPPHTILTEVGIDAVDGAQLRPFIHEWPNVTTLDPQVQARWFRAACHAAVKEHLGGIYFWPIGLGPNPGAGPTFSFQGAWGGAGAQAISACFASVERSGK
jgi:hypothetical protein